MNHTIFTVEEENIICAFDVNDRDAVIAALRGTIPEFEENEMREIAESALRKLDAMTGAEFSALILSPVYNDDESEV